MSNLILGKNILAIKSINSELEDLEIKKRLDDFRVDVFIDSKDPNEIEIGYVLLNLLPRLFSQVKLRGNLDILTKFPVSHQIKINIGKSDWKPSLTIYIGNKKIKAKNPVLYVGSCGWTAYLSFQKPCDYNPYEKNMIGAALAGGLAANEAFKMAFPDLLGIKPIKNLVYDPLTHGTGKNPVIKPKIPSNIYFEDLTLIGLGGIGIGVAYCLSKLPSITGNLRLIDPETTDESNEQRYFLSFSETRGARKIDLAASHLITSQPLLNVKGFPGYYEGFINQSDDIKLPLVIITVDDDSTRKNLQANLPKVVLNGWTETENTNMAYGIGKHEFNSKNECLACAYYPTSAPEDDYDMYSFRTGFTVEEIKKRQKEKTLLTPEDIQFISDHSGNNINNLSRFKGQPIDELLHGFCGLFTVPLEDKPAVAPVPHIPFLVAIHLVTQLLIPHLEYSEEIKPIESAAIFYGLKYPSIDNLEPHDKNPDCFCSDEVYLDAYKEKWRIS